MTPAGLVGGLVPGRVAAPAPPGVRTAAGAGAASQGGGPEHRHQQAGPHRCADCSCRSDGPGRRPVPSGRDHGSRVLRACPSTLAQRLAERDRQPVILDGGLATELERRGQDVSGALWSARILASDPGPDPRGPRGVLRGRGRGRHDGELPGDVRRVRRHRGRRGPDDRAAAPQRAARRPGPPGRAGRRPGRGPTGPPALGGRVGRPVRRAAGRRLGVPRRLRPDRRRAAGVPPAPAAGAGPGPARPATR